MKQVIDHRRNGRLTVLLVGLLGLCLSLGSVVVAQEATSEAVATEPSEGATSAALVAEGIPAASASEASPETIADEKGDVSANLGFALNNITLMICAVLVIFMQAGFAMVEVGLNPAKHTVNILCKNVLDFSVGVILFFTIGYALMYPGFNPDGGNEWFGIDLSRIFAISSWDGEAALHPQVDFLFQAAFAATAATIVSGAVAGRMKFSAYLVYSAFITAIVYPISGSWKWGYGWLHDMGFHDFAGSVVVHAVGGFAGLAGAIILGSRIGRFTSDGKSVPIPGHNMSLSALGVFILLVGWFGFNPGSQLAFDSHANIEVVMRVASNTTIAAAAGSIVCMLVAWLMFGKPDLTMALNGMLGGLVGITANCDCVSNGSAAIIGAAAGVLVLIGIVVLEKFRIDDPVGAFPVHGICGMWGCIAAGLFGGKDLVAQLTGTGVICAWAFATMFALFAILKMVGMLRVSPEEEQTGLDISEHGMHAYPAEPMARVG
jgi:ammonium transporter, Amt family